jgi:predicted DNA-binding transcriptional regulator YafY
MFMGKVEMDREHETQRALEGKYTSTQKTLRTVSLAILFHTYWPKHLSRDELIKHLATFYGTTPIPTLYRDIATLTGMPVEALPRPDDPDLEEWCGTQQDLKRFAIAYDRAAIAFRLVQSFFTIDIDEDEARAFVALQESFTPGTPYADAVRRLLKRWEWLFNEKSHQLVQRKRQRRARPIVLPLSPVVDYSKHEATIFQLDKALEEGAYISFAYTPLAQGRDAEPIWHTHIEPYELEYRDGHWYFTAYVLELSTFLDYRVDRIQPDSTQIAHERFTPGLRKGPGVKIRYWVSPQLARHTSLSARLRDQHVTLLENDQGAIVEGYARSNWWARRLLLGYGELVKALEPEELVEMMRKTVRAMNEVYGEEE